MLSAHGHPPQVQAGGSELQSQLLRLTVGTKWSVGQPEACLNAN